MKVVLIGYRASGKTTIGKRLAECLGWPFLDVDRGIEEASGMTLSQLFQERGEPFYRNLENQVVTEMCSGNECVVTFGAGTIIQLQNQKLARHESLVVYLEATPEVLWHRMESDPNTINTRPNLSIGGYEEVVQMLSKRAPIYKKCADLICDATIDPEILSNRILQFLLKEENQ